MSKVAIIDYGAGNLQSVVNALNYLGVTPIVSGEVSVLEKADALILPGVGHFGPLTEALHREDADDAIKAHIAGNKPFLGICLGMQALFEGSDEAPDAQAMGIAKGWVHKLSGDVKVPHIGWNEVAVRGETQLFKGIPTEQYFYFAHSFAVPVLKETVGICEYGVVGTLSAASARRHPHPGSRTHRPSPAEQARGSEDEIHAKAEFSAAIERGNLSGVQFHPEKSGDAGLQVLKNFLEIAKC